MKNFIFFYFRKKLSTASGVSQNTLDITEPSALATGQSTTMPASEYSEDQIFHDTESDEESLYDFEVMSTVDKGPSIELI